MPQKREPFGVVTLLGLPEPQNLAPVLRPEDSGRRADDPVSATDAALRRLTLRYDLDRRRDGDASGDELVEPAREDEVYDLVAGQPVRHTGKPSLG